MAIVKKQEADSLFAETIKAVDIASRMEEEASKRLTTDEKLKIVKDYKPKNREEYLEQDELKKQLELDIRFNTDPKLILPEEHREKIQRNYEIERQEAAAVLEQKYEDLNFIVEEFYEKMIPALGDIELAERNKYHASHIEAVLDGKISLNPAFLRDLGGDLVNLDSSTKAKMVEKAGEKVSETVKLLKRLSKVRG